MAKLTLLSVVAVVLAVGITASESGRRDHVPTVNPSISNPEHPAIVGSDRASDLDALCAEALSLSEAADAAGGLEIGSAGFHEFPGNSLQSLFVYSVFYPSEDQPGPVTLQRVIVDVRRQEVMTRGVVAVEVVNSPSHNGFFDVRVRFNQSVPPFARSKQAQREHAYSIGEQPHDQGLALIYNGILYGDATYGEIATAANSGEGWVTVVKGTTSGEAALIAGALQP
jgi:hypothetical protein